MIRHAPPEEVFEVTREVAERIWAIPPNIAAAIVFVIVGLDAILGGFLAGSGVAAIVLGFAFKEIGENFLAGLFLAFSRPFDIGDLILSDTLEGGV